MPSIFIRYSISLNRIRKCSVIERVRNRLYFVIFVCDLRWTIHFWNAPRNVLSAVQLLFLHVYSMFSVWLLVIDGKISSSSLFKQVLCTAVMSRRILVTIEWCGFLLVYSAVWIIVKVSSLVFKNACFLRLFSNLNILRNSVSFHFYQFWI